MEQGAQASLTKNIVRSLRWPFKFHLGKTDLLQSIGIQTHVLNAIEPVSKCSLLLCRCKYVRAL